MIRLNHRLLEDSSLFYLEQTEKYFQSKPIKVHHIDLGDEELSDNVARIFKPIRFFIDRTHTPQNYFDVHLPALSYGTLILDEFSEGVMFHIAGEKHIRLLNVSKENVEKLFYKYVDWLKLLIKSELFL